MTHKLSSCPELLCCGSASLQLLHIHAIPFSVWLVTHEICGLLADRLISKSMHAHVQVLKDALPTYDMGMLEQMSMVYILMQDPDMIKRMHFEHGYCFNCWYRNMDDPRIDHPAFVVHFAGETAMLLHRMEAVPAS